MEAIDLCVDGRHVKPDDTPTTLGLDNEDQLDVFLLEADEGVKDKQSSIESHRSDDDVSPLPLPVPSSSSKSCLPPSTIPSLPKSAMVPQHAAGSSATEASCFFVSFLTGPPPAKERTDIKSGMVKMFAEQPLDQLALRFEQQHHASFDFYINGTLIQDLGKATPKLLGLGPNSLIEVVIRQIQH